MKFRSLLREPLLHFLLIGFALFLLFGRVAPDDGDDRRILIDRALVESLALQFQSTWIRPPTEEELANLVAAHVREEIFYREGRALGLDRDDSVIRRRVRQKFEVMMEDAGVGPPPDDAVLEAFLRARPDSFREPPRISFEQILVVSGGAAPPDVAQAVEAIREALAAGGDPATLGRPTMLPAGADDRSLDLIARDFGRDFADALRDLPIGDWSGPVPSAFGQHLVRLSARTEARVPPLAAVRDRVRREWELQQRVDHLDALYDRLLQEYEIVTDAGIAEP